MPVPVSAIVESSAILMSLYPAFLYYVIPKFYSINIPQFNDFFITVSGKTHPIYGWDESEPFYITEEYISCQLVDIMKEGRITYISMYACARKVEWLSMEGKVPSGRGECKPVETPPVAFEAGSP